MRFPKDRPRYDPSEALLHHEDGTVGFELDVDPQGRPTTCRALASSGSHALDVRTCEVMILRARFIPARDAAGHRAPDTVSARVRWVLPDYGRIYGPMGAC